MCINKVYNAIVFSHLTDSRDKMAHLISRHKLDNCGNETRMMGRTATLLLGETGNYCVL